MKFTDTEWTDPAPGPLDLPDLPAPDSGPGIRPRTFDEYVGQEAVIEGLKISIEAATARRVPLSVVELRDQTLEGRYGATLLLVRPDQHVAWRGASVDRPMADAIIAQVCGA